MSRAYFSAIVFSSLSLLVTVASGAEPKLIVTPEKPLQGERFVVELEGTDESASPVWTLKIDGKVATEKLKMRGKLAGAVDSAPTGKYEISIKAPEADPLQFEIGTPKKADKSGDSTKKRTASAVKKFEEFVKKAKDRPLGLKALSQVVMEMWESTENNNDRFGAMASKLEARRDTFTGKSPTASVVEELASIIDLISAFRALTNKVTAEQVEEILEAAFGGVTPPASNPKPLVEHLADENQAAELATKIARLTGLPEAGNPRLLDHRFNETCDKLIVAVRGRLQENLTHDEMGLRIVQDVRKIASETAGEFGPRAWGKFFEVILTPAVLGTLDLSQDKDLKSYAMSFINGLEMAKNLKEADLNNAAQGTNPSSAGGGRSSGAGAGSGTYYSRAAVFHERMVSSILRRSERRSLAISRVQMRR